MIGFRSPLVLLSGGMDSSTLLAWALDRPDVDRASALFVDYGQRHVVERTSSQLVAQHYGAAWSELDLRAFGASVNSALTVMAREVPHGHYAEDNMVQTVVPNRNATLISAAAGIAASLGHDAVLTAVHVGDHAVYPDCRPEFVAAIDMATYAGCGVHVVAPFQTGDKADIARLGGKLGVPYHLTWSCYEGGLNDARHCGRCGTCVERAEAFAEAGVPDPTEYADAEFWKQAVANA
ncbi:Pre Qo pathway QueC-like protein [Mycobacterium phage Godines]|uniref:7-cyano-7-deazaguanine synthase n=1 Tax=Mycobacterium phage Godines TaxID=1675551 RepID=A0A0K1LRN5_9CAUD|nr:QueC-like queuosine biosynthesis [Mycobacterium phage Godines]AKU45202.1 Pre Qo pathway QueC-like protein [Mycobacterium phage Godines]